MTDSKIKTGTIQWVDLTVNDADKIRDFYGEVVGWKSDPVPMDGYDDYCMIGNSSDDPVAGICHARGVNADLPPHWIVYITVDDLDKSVTACKALGGEIISGPKSMGKSGRYCIIKDPAGAVAALFESTPQTDSK